MKIKDLMMSGHGHSEDTPPIYKYYEQDCVIGFYKCLLGTVFVFKGKTKCFAYLHQGVDVLRARMSYSITRLYDNYYGKEMTKAVDMIERHGEILDLEEWTKMKKKMVLEGI